MSIMSVQAAVQEGLSAHKRNDHKQAQHIFEQILEQVPQHTDALHYLGLTLAALNDPTLAKEYLLKAVELEPSRSHYWHNLGIYYLEQQQPEEAKSAINKALLIEPDNAVYHGNMVRTLKELGEQPPAIAHGNKCLQLKDAAALEAFELLNPRPALRHKNILPGYGLNQLNIISFCLWGNNPKYTVGAIINAAIAPYIYPEWVCRFYCSQNVDKAILDKLVNYGAQVILMREPKSEYEALLWRFLPSDDEGVTRFICRDTDSRLNVQEKLAVDEWVNSSYPFHVMRDNILHAELILAGMWGGIAGVLPPIAELNTIFSDDGHPHWLDQHFTRNLIWPLIKEKHLAHDNYYSISPHTKAFSTSGRRHLPLTIGSIETWDLERWRIK